MKEADNFEQSMNELLSSKFVFVNAKDVLRIINKHIPIELVGKRKNKAKVVGCYVFLMQHHTNCVYSLRDFANQWGLKYVQSIQHFISRHKQMYAESEGYRHLVLLCLRDMKRKNDRLKKVFENKITNTEL
jgi:hypothetical protein